jgi:hypothetical protein
MQQALQYIINIYKMLTSQWVRNLDSTSQQFE